MVPTSTCECSPIRTKYHATYNTCMPFESAIPHGILQCLFSVVPCHLYAQCTGIEGSVIVTVFPFVFAVPVFTRTFSGVLANCKVKIASAAIVLPTRGITETSVAGFCTVYCSVCFPSSHATSTRNAPELNGPVTVTVFPFVFAVPVFTRTFSGTPSKRSINAVSAEIVLPARGRDRNKRYRFPHGVL